MRRFAIVIGLAVAALLSGAATVWGRQHRNRPATSSHRHSAGHRRRSARHHAPHHRRRHAGRHRRHRRPPRHQPAQPGGTTSPGTTPPTSGGGSTTPSAGPCPSGPPASTQSIGGNAYALEGMDTFTKAAPVGSFAQTTNNQIVYTGDHGMAWTGYPDGTRSTYSGGAEGYQPSTVLSVHDGVLDFFLHDDSNRNPVGADPSPLPGGNRYQTYGAWSFCERVAPADSHNLYDFKQAPLLWPQNDSDSPSSESDFPEGDFSALDFSGFSHYGGSGSQDVFDIHSVDPSFDPTQWHVYTQTWGPGFRSYFVDGQLVGTSTNQVWSGPERWQLQIEPLAGRNDGDTGHVYVKWVWIGTPG
jgi:hypothetical protein